MSTVHYYTANVYFLAGFSGMYVVWLFLKKECYIMTSTLCSQEIATMFLMVILKLDESDLRVNCLSKKKKKGKKQSTAPNVSRGRGWGAAENRKTGEQGNNKNSMRTESSNFKTIKRFRVCTRIVCHLYIRKEGNQYLLESSNPSMWY